MHTNDNGPMTAGDDTTAAMRWMKPLCCATMLFALVGAQGCSTATLAGCGVGVATGVALAGIAAASSKETSDMTGIAMLGGGMFGVTSGCSAAAVAAAIASPSAREVEEEKTSKVPPSSWAPAVTVVPAPVYAAGQPPATAAGFALGTDIAAAEARCTEASLAWSKLNDRQFTCSGAPADVGVPATVKLTTCGGLVCKVAVNGSADGAAWGTLTERFNALTASLEQSHGGTYQRDARPLSDCTQATSQCFAAGRVRRTMTWQWPNKQSVLLVLSGAPVGGTPSLGVFYRTPAYSEETP